MAEEIMEEVSSILKKLRKDVDTISEDNVILLKRQRIKLMCKNGKQKIY